MDHRKTTNTLFLFILSITFMSCKKDTRTLLLQKGELVILSEMNQQNNLKVNLSLSKPGFDNVDDASVTITDLHQNMVENLVPNGNGNYIGSKGHSNVDYKLSVRYKGRLFESSQMIPSPFKLSVDTLNTTSILIYLDDIKAEESYFTFELFSRTYQVRRFYLLNNQRFEVESENLLQQILKNHPSYEIVRDTTFSNNVTRINMSTSDDRTENVKYNEFKGIIGRIFLKQSKKSTTLITTFTRPKDAILTLKAKLLTPEYFQYLYAMDLQNANARMGYYNIPLKGNFVGAFGIFGAAYVNQKTF